jgi:hypothetical protein
MIRSARFIIAAASLAAAPAWAAPCPSGPSYHFLRYNEDFRYLRDPACRTDAWDAVKFMALDDAGERFLTLGGDVRLKLVNSRDVLLGDDLGDNDNVVPQRYHVHANLRAASWLRVFAELKFNDVSGREPGPMPADVNRGDTHQLFVDVQPVADATLRVGRQELLYGSGRRIFPANGSNVRGTFDAAKVMFAGKNWAADALVFRPVEIDKGPFDDSSIDNQTFGGIYAVTTPPMLAPFALDLYWLAGRRERARFDQGLGTDYRHSFGARFAGIRGPWDLDAEATWQAGHFGAGDIRAWAVTADAGYRIAASVPLRAALRLSAASGDRDRNAPDLQTFHWLFPKGPHAGQQLRDRHGQRALRAGRPGGRPVLERPNEHRPRVDRPHQPRGHDLPAERHAPASGGTVARSRVGTDVGMTLQWLADRHTLLFFQAAVMEPGPFLRDGRLHEANEVRDADSRVSLLS